MNPSAGLKIADPMEGKSRHPIIEEEDRLQNRLEWHTVIRFRLLRDTIKKRVPEDLPLH